MQNRINHPAFRELKKDAREFLRALFLLLKQSRRTVLLFAVLLGLLAVVLHPVDLPLNRKMIRFERNQPDEHLLQLARAFRTWGDFRDTVIITVLLLGGGWLFRRREWRRLAVAFFLSVSLSGVAVNTLRFTAGRPRPYTKKVTEDRWYGPVLLYPESMKPADTKLRNFQSFPSGHAGTSAGGASMLLIAAPALGIPMLITAVCINLSSLYCNVHYLTDVTVGSGIGLIFGVAGGLIYRRMRSTASCR